MATRVLLTGFEPFAGWSANPSERAALALGEDSRLRAAGIATAVLPVHRASAPARLLELLRRLQPEALVMTGLAAGRAEICLERIGVNAWRPPGRAGLGHAIDVDGPDGLFATLPAVGALRALRRGGAPARISESAGTYCCNLVLYRALRWSLAGRLPGGGRAPRLVGFVHLPATTETLPAGRTEPSVPQQAVDEGLAALCRFLARGHDAARPRGRSR
jgi:pyroglutamyl-peptidase